MSKNIIRITNSDLHRIIQETINIILKENMHHIYEFLDTCVNMDAEDVQSITHFDEYSNNDYFIGDDYFNSEIIIIPIEYFLSHIRGYRPKHIDYCALNVRYDIAFIYDSENDIHYFYK